MKIKPKVGFISLLIFAQLVFYPRWFAQRLGLEPDKWAIELAKAVLTEPNSMGSLSLQLEEVDSTRALRFLNSLETADQAKGYFFRAHFCFDGIVLCNSITIQLYLKYT